MTKHLFEAEERLIRVQRGLRKVANFVGVLTGVLVVAFLTWFALGLGAPIRDSGLAVLSERFRVLGESIDSVRDGLIARRELIASLERLDALDSIGRPSVPEDAVVEVGAARLNRIEVLLEQSRAAFLESEERSDSLGQRLAALESALQVSAEEALRVVLLERDVQGLEETHEREVAALDRQLDRVAAQSR